MRRKRNIGMAAIFVAAAIMAFAPLPAIADTQQAAGAFFSEGERLFREDKPKDAAALLEKAVADPSVDERAWLYLAACYEELGRYDDAVAALRKGLGQAARYKHLFLYDMGNAYVLQGKNSFAEEMYGQSISANGNYAPAYLNRANVRIILKDYTGARDDYGAYLALEPQSPQRANIEELLKRLGADLAAQEAAAAQAAAAQAAAAKARQDLLDSVQASLKASAEETTSLSAGSGQVQGYGDDLNLDQ
jgi:tetratricopeptide (TPR) repeat protein